MLSAQLERFEPDIFAVNETCLDASVAKVDLPGYQLVSRRDRPTSKVCKVNHGDVKVHSRIGTVLVTYLKDSNVAERSWHIIHADVGGVLFANWYRAPGNPHNHIDSSNCELEGISVGLFRNLVVGDINI